MAEEKKTKTEKKDEKHYIVLTDEKGKDVKVQILFSIVHPDTKERFLYVVDPSDEDAVVIFHLDKDGESLTMVDENEVSKETMEFLQDAFQSYLKGDLAPVEGDEEDEDGEDEDDEDDKGEHECHCHDDKCTCGGKGHGKEHHHHEGECCCGNEKCECEKEDK